jgi:hypothetical protein
VSTEQFAPRSTVPREGLYQCLLCALSLDLARATGRDPFVIASAYAKEMGVGPDAIRGLFAGSKEPIVRMRFKALDRFDECPIHKSATGWVLERE